MTELTTAGSEQSQDWKWAQCLSAVPFLTRGDTGLDSHGLSGLSGDEWILKGWK